MKQNKYFGPISKTVLVIVFVLTLLTCSLIGGLVHTLEKATGGWVIGGTVHYVLHYGDAYSWEPGYDKLQGWLKGDFPETKCGALYLDAPPKLRWVENPDEPYIYSTGCGLFMDLPTFLQRYLGGATYQELLTKPEDMESGKTVELFNDLKKRGVLEDIRSKEVNLYAWDNISHLTLWVFFIPFGLALLVSGVLAGIIFLVTRMFRRLRTGSSG